MCPNENCNDAAPPASCKADSGGRLPFPALVASLAGRPLRPDELLEVRTRLQTIRDTLRAIAARLEAQNP